MFPGLVVTAVGTIGGSVGPSLQLPYSAIFPRGNNVSLTGGGGPRRPVLRQVDPNSSGGSELWGSIAVGGLGPWCATSFASRSCLALGY